MKSVSFIFNLPYTVVGLLMACISWPTSVHLRHQPIAVVLTVKRFWWAFGWLHTARAFTIGHTVLLGPAARSGDLAHELVHVGQYARLPLVFPCLYYIELFKKGYRYNKYESEAFRANEAP